MNTTRNAQRRVSPLQVSRQINADWSKHMSRMATEPAYRAAYDELVNGHVDAAVALLGGVR